VAVRLRQGVALRRTRRSVATTRIVSVGGGQSHGLAAGRRHR